MYKIFLQRTTNALGCMNVISSHSNHQHISATQVAFFRVMRTRMCIQL